MEIRAKFKDRPCMTEAGYLQMRNVYFVIPVEHESSISDYVKFNMLNFKQAAWFSFKCVKKILGSLDINPTDAILQIEEFLKN
jgi:hypothetical protein